MIKLVFKRILIKLFQYLQNFIFCDNYWINPYFEQVSTCDYHWLRVWSTLLIKDWGSHRTKKSHPALKQKDWNTIFNPNRASLFSADKIKFINVSVVGYTKHWKITIERMWKAGTSKIISNKLLWNNDAVLVKMGYKSVFNDDFRNFAENRQ